MQKSWYLDDDKCTFIVLEAAKIPAAAAAAQDDREQEVAAMVGDVNLFFNDHDDATSAELEVMIAEPAARGRGLGGSKKLYI